MKKILCLVLSIVLVLSLVACGNKEEEILAKYDSVDIADIQGKISDVFYTLDYTAINVNGEMREYDPYAEQAGQYISYDLGDCKDIVVYSENVVVVEQKDGKLKTIVVLRDEDAKTCKTHEIKYDVDAKDFAYADCYDYTEGEESVVLVYKDGSDFKYYIHDLNGTEISKGDWSDIYEEYDDEDFVIDQIVYTSNGDAYALNKDKEIRGLDFYGSSIDGFDSGSAEIDDIDEWLAINFTVDVIVTHSNDDKNVYFYHKGEERYAQSGKIELPKSYKTSDIKTVLELYKGLFIEFEDGEYYTCSYDQDFGTGEVSGEVKWENIDDFKKAAGSGTLIEMAGQLCVLKDGTFYQYIGQQ